MTEVQVDRFIIANPGEVFPIFSVQTKPPVEVPQSPKTLWFYLSAWWRGESVIREKLYRVESVIGIKSSIFSDGSITADTEAGTK